MSFWMETKFKFLVTSWMSRSWHHEIFCTRPSLQWACWWVIRIWNLSSVHLDLLKLCIWRQEDSNHNMPTFSKINRTDLWSIFGERIFLFLSDRTACAPAHPYAQSCESATPSGLAIFWPILISSTILWSSQRFFLFLFHSPLQFYFHFFPLSVFARMLFTSFIRMFWNYLTRIFRNLPWLSEFYISNPEEGTQKS